MASGDLILAVQRREKWVTSHICYILNMVVFLSGG